MKKQSKTLVSLCLIAGVLNLSACGTILYPERKGQVDGRVDAGVVALDAVGLLFWFIPGVVAFAVDFSNGTIYLPGGERAQLSDEEMESIVDADGKVDQKALNEMVAEKSDMEGDDLSELRVRSLNSVEQVSQLMQENDLKVAVKTEELLKAS